MLSEFAKNEIQDFWSWVSEHKDDVAVQFYSEEQFWLYVALEHDMLEEFTDRYQYHCEEGGCACVLQMNCLCFDMVDIEGGGTASL